MVVYVAALQVNMVLSRSEGDAVLGVRVRRTSCTSKACDVSDARRSDIAGVRDAIAITVSLRSICDFATIQDAVSVAVMSWKFCRIADAVLVAVARAAWGILVHEVVETPVVAQAI